MTFSRHRQYRRGYDGQAAQLCVMTETSLDPARPIPHITKGTIVADFANDTPNHQEVQRESLEHAHPPGARSLPTAAHHQTLLDEDIKYDAWLDDCLANVETEEEDGRHDA